MFINWNAQLGASDYEKILKESYANEIGFATKLLIVDEARYFDKWQEFTEEEKDKLIDYVYSYYCDCDNEDVTLYKLVSFVFNEFDHETWHELTYEKFEREAIDNVF